MYTYKVKNIITVLVFTVFGSVALADEQETPGPSNHFQNEITLLINEAVHEIIEPAINKAKKVVQEQTEIDPSLQGYVLGREYQPLPDCTSDKAHFELNQVRDEYIADAGKLLDEFERKMNRTELDFAEAAGKVDKIEKVGGKRNQLKRNVDKVYTEFEEKLSSLNRETDKERDRIINWELESDYCAQVDRVPHPAINSKPV